MESEKLRIRWSPKLPVAKIVRLYQADATGIRDEVLLADVAWRLRVRCWSILLVTASRVACPACGAEFSVRPNAAPETPFWQQPRPDDVPSPCPSCGLTIKVEEFLASIHHRELGGPTGQCQEFVERFDAAAGYAERLLLVDRLVHAVHQTGGVAVRNLFEGRARQVLGHARRPDGGCGRPRFNAGRPGADPAAGPPTGPGARHPGTRRLVPAPAC